jgi:ubiquinone/menaquinone biosynthesis C-methylase UbiE
VTEKQLKVFFEIHSGLPREAPGSNQSTRIAFASITDLPRNPVILDIGCGPGAQTIAIAQLSEGLIHAVDNHRPFLEQLKQNAARAGLNGKIISSLGDMNELPFKANSFDLIWAEASLYIIGVKKAFELWRPLIRSNGYIAFTEISWLRRDLPEEIRTFWRNAYPSMTSISENIKIIESSGFELVRRFNLPEDDWWSDYYNPITKKLPALKNKYKDDPEALDVIANEENEIDLFRRYSAYFGYVFYIARRID